jgi:hypothetical protein
MIETNSYPANIAPPELFRHVNDIPIVFKRDIFRRLGSSYTIRK